MGQTVCELGGQQALMKQCSKTFSLLHVAKPPSKAKLWDTQDTTTRQNWTGNERSPSLVNPVLVVTAEYFRVEHWPLIHSWGDGRMGKGICLQV